MVGSVAKLKSGVKLKSAALKEKKFSVEEKLLAAIFGYRSPGDYYKVSKEIGLQFRGARILYKQAYEELCETVTGKKPNKKPPPQLAFKKKVLKYLNENRDEMYQKICIEFKYCERKESWGSWPKFLQGLVLLIALIADSTATGGAASAIWLITSSTLDEFCQCSKSKKRKVANKKSKP